MELREPRAYQFFFPGEMGWKALTLVASAAASSVLDFDPSSIAIATRHNRAFVKFFAPWCGHCKKLAPTWELLAQSADLSGAQIGRVDCTSNAALCKSYGVRAFPALIMVEPGGQLRNHGGARDLRSLAEFAASGWKDAPVFDPRKLPSPATSTALWKKLLSSPISFVLTAILVLTAVMLMCVCFCCNPNAGEYDDDDAHEASRAAKPEKAD